VKDADVLFPSEQQVLEGWKRRRAMHEASDNGGEVFAEERPHIGGAMPPLKRALHEFKERGLSPVPYVQEVEAQGTEQHGGLGSRRTLGESQSYENIGSLKEDTTRPLRILANYDLLYEASAPRYSTCFRAGDWFKVGVPATSSPPSSPTCSRGSVEQGFDVDCWGRCEERDVVTPANAQFIRSEIEVLLPYVQSLFRVPRLVGDVLRLSTSAGSYPSLYNSLGHRGPACFADCSLLLGLTVPSSYCAGAGIAADAVLFVQRTPSVEGVQGTAFSCATDQFGRPIGLVFSWLKDYEPMSNVLYDYFRDVQTKAPTLAPGLGLPQRTGGAAAPIAGQSSFRVVVHELLHGLGFTIGSWLYHASGSRVARTTFKDADGTQEEVYAFNTNTRTHELMKTYYECDKDSVRFPLMSWPTFARDSHQATRMLPQDILAYGGGKVITPFTLSMMEDTGFYLANYSKADPISWGRGQGCEFVASRCTYRKNAYSVDASSDPTRCSVAYFKGISYITTGNKECGRELCAKYDSNTRTVAPASLAGGKCIAECYSPDVDWYEGKDFKSQVTLNSSLGAAYDTLYENFDVLIVVALVLAFLLAGGGRVGLRIFHNTFFQTPQQTARWIKLIQGLALLLGLLIVLPCIYIYYVDWSNWKGFVTEAQLFVVFSTGLVILLFSAVQLWVVFGHYRNHTAVVLCMVMQVLFIIAQGFVFYYMYSLLTRTALLASGAEDRFGKGGPEDLYVGDGLRAFEFTACETYRTCCRDPNLLTASQLDGLDTPAEQLALEESTGKFATCVQGTQGGGTALEREQLAETDPSQSTFCAVRTGEKGYEFAKPEEGACASVLGPNAIRVDAKECQADFCKSGVSGYVAFLQAFITLLEEWSTTLAVAFFIMIVIQLMNFALFEGLREISAKLNYLDHDDHLHYTPGEGNHVGAYHAHHTNNLKRDVEQDGLHWEQMTQFERVAMIKEYGISSVRAVFPAHRIQTPPDSDDDD